MVSGILNKIQLPLNKKINLYKNILKDFYLNKKKRIYR